MSKASGYVSSRGAFTVGASNRVRSNAAAFFATRGASITAVRETTVRGRVKTSYRVMDTSSKVHTYSTAQVKRMSKKYAAAVHKAGRKQTE